MKIALVQMDIALGDVRANRKKAAAMLEDGIAAGAELLVLPELWTTGYQLADIHLLAEPDTGETLTMLRHLARTHGVEIVTGSMAEARDGKIYNTAYAIDPAGLIIARYSKIHLIGLMAEDQYITPGCDRSVFDLRLGPAGMIICYDLRFAELPRALALAGCQALFVPAEWPTARGSHWRALNIARAIENQMYVVAVNRVGRDRDNEFFGHSMIVDPWGEIIAEGSETEEQVIVAEVDFAAVAEIRQRIPVFADRRPECY